MSLPIGSIVASILSAEDFQSHMPSGETWRLANADAIPHGPLLNTVTNKAYYKALNVQGVMHLPDLRGVFLRGQNSGHATTSGQDPSKKRGDGRGNPADVDVGDYQSDDVGPHIHSQRVGYPDGGYSGSVPAPNGAWHGAASDDTGSPKPDGPDHPRVESRPRSVTVNYFIRVA
jgi:hypothetical protein